tara:strand:- start:9806 stop:10174 length:369 start_codon:yes stop_codon:yes gene_type:complete
MSKTVFVADDDPDIRSLLEIALSDIGGYEVIFAETGAHALSMTEELGRADIALLDMYLPDMQGPELLARMREIAPAKLKFLFLTGAIKKVREELAQLEPDGIITKPFNPLTLAEEIRQYLPD